MALKDREETYARAQLGAKIGFGKRPAVVIVDFQSGFSKATNMGGDMGEQVLQTKKLADFCRGKNIKIIYSRMGFNKDGSDMGVWALKVPALHEYTRDHPYYEFDDRLGIQPEDILIEKHAASSFVGTNLTNILTSLHIDTVILGGCTVSGCLYATVVDACSMGFRPILATDCSADRSEEMKEIFMWNLGQKYADLMTSQEIMDIVGKLEPLSYTMLY